MEMTKEDIIKLIEKIKNPWNIVHNCDEGLNKKEGFERARADILKEITRDKPYNKTRLHQGILNSGSVNYIYKESMSTNSGYGGRVN